MSGSENQSSKKIIFKGKDLSLGPDGVNYTKSGPVSLKAGLVKSVGSKSYPSLKDALKDVRRVLGKFQ